VDKIGKGVNVNLLTTHNASRHIYDGWPKIGSVRLALRMYFVVVIIFTALAVVATAHAAKWQSNQEISKVAEDYVVQRFGKTDGRMVPKAGHLDSRLRLPQCDTVLQPFLRPGATVTSRTVVGVRCEGSRPWKVYVPVNVIVVESILVAKMTLARGHVLTVTDVVAEDYDISRLPGGYVSNVDRLIGKKLKHQITAGRIITPGMLEAELIVRRGQSVTLIITSGTLNITMAGKALTDGGLNQRIRIENSGSGRIVEGIVRSSEHVEVLVH